MSTIKSQINPRAEDFRANAAALGALVADLRARTAEVSLGQSSSESCPVRIRDWSIRPSEESILNVDHGEFDHVGSGSLDRGVDGSAFGRPWDGEVPGIDIAQVAT